ncbi:hypothetical protein EVAR_47770_1 [Eumeta japonica]|uniref:Uncharacterized protein n=1 Tax=Eumeta variegata TaxID=151549 RepID=A0A4C1XY17_EUMVA|nr:hypothetical protein EVAR_47770_1 [Eumeta japonica]
MSKAPPPRTIMATHEVTNEFLSLSQIKSYPSCSEGHIKPSLPNVVTREVTTVSNPGLRVALRRREQFGSKSLELKQKDCVCPSTHALTGVGTNGDKHWITSGVQEVTRYRGRGGRGGRGRRDGRRIRNNKLSVERRENASDTHWASANGEDDSLMPLRRDTFSASSIIWTRTVRATIVLDACLQHASTCSIQPTADSLICLSTTNFYPKT